MIYKSGKQEDVLIPPDANGARDSIKRFNAVTDEGDRIRKLISGDPMKFLHTNGG